LAFEGRVVLFKDTTAT